MKKRIFLLSVFLVLFAVTLSAMPISFHQAEQTAKLKLQIEDKNDYIVKDFYELKGNDGSILAYVYHLDPQGFIIVTTDTDIVPILGYSFLNNFEEVEESEWTIGHYYVQLDLTLRNEAIPYTSSDVIAQSTLTLSF